MANPYQGISKEEVVEKIVYCLLKFPESSRENIVNFGVFQRNLDDRDDQDGKIYSTSTITLNLIRDAIGISDYMEMAVVALRYLEIHKKVEEIKNR